MYFTKRFIKYTHRYFMHLNLKPKSIFSINQVKIYEYELN